MDFSEKLSIADWIFERVIPVTLVVMFGYWCAYILLRGVGHGKG